MGLGNNNSGLSFHFHGPGLSEAIVGRKRWFLYPPGMQPHGGYDQLVNTSLSQWILSENFGSCESSLLDAIAISSMPSIFESYSVNTLDQLDKSGEHTEQGKISPCFYDCTIGKNEVLYFPSGWYHGTLNQDPFTLFASVFL